MCSVTTITNYTTAVGTTDYTAAYLLQSDDNVIFADWFGDPAADGYEYGAQLINQHNAVVTHSWNVKPIQIRTSTMGSDWTGKTEYYDAEGDYYAVPIANVMTDYGNVLDVKYYSDAACTTEITDITTGINVTPGTIDTYYIQLTVKERSKQELRIIQYDIRSCNGQDREAVYGGRQPHGSTRRIRTERVYL